MPRISFLLTFLQLISTYVVGQNSSSVDSSYVATRQKYVENRTGDLTLRVFTLTHNDQLSYKGPLVNNRELIFKPNVPTNIGLGFNYQWLGLSVSFINPSYNLEVEKKGRTRYFDILLNTYSKKFGVDAYYVSYKGYYLSNPGNRKSEQEPFPQRPDFRTVAIGAQFFYYFNHKKYSYRAPFIQTERQKKSAGSFVLNPHFSYFSIKSDSALTPGIQNPGSYRGGNFYTIGVGPGYAHTFVWRRFYINFTLIPSIFIQYQDIRHFDDEFDRSGIVTGLRFTGKFALGYNSDKFFIGISSSGDTYNIKLEKNTDLRYTIGAGRFFIGYRIPLKLNIFPFKKSEPNILLEKQ